MERFVDIKVDVGDDDNDSDESSDEVRKDFVRNDDNDDAD